MRGFGGVVMLFAMSVVAFVGSLAPLSERIEWWIGGRDAVMVLLMGTGVFAYRIYRRERPA